MAASDAKPFPIKGSAYRVIFPIFDADGDLVAGATGLDTELSLDCGTFADATNEATEIATSSGMYYLDLTAAEMNYDSVAIIVKTSTSDAKTTPIVLYPTENGDISVNVTQISGDSTAADNAESFFDGTGYAGTNNVIPSVTTVTGNVNGSVASVTGAVASVTGNVGGSVASVTGAVGSVTGNVGGSVASVTGNVGGNVTGSVGSLATQAKADVNAECDTAVSDAALATAANLAAAKAVVDAINTIVGHADYGNAKLVRSTTPANTLTVDANHLVAVPATQKVDLETIKTQTVTCSAGVTVPSDPADQSEVQALIEALNDPSAADIVAAVFAQIVDGTVTFLAAQKHQLAKASGNASKSSNTVAYKDRSENTLFSLTASADAITRS